MAKKKYYAVRKGVKTGLFESWSDCEPLVTGFVGAEFKSFPTKKEALGYLDGAEPETEPKEKTGRTKKKDLAYYLEESRNSFDFAALPDDTVVAYVDGSFDGKTGKYACGVVLLTKKDGLQTRAEVGENKEAAAARNVAGELSGTMQAAAYAVKNGYQKLIVHHDYTGIAAWYRGEWKAESYCARNYVAFMKKLPDSLLISFRKVKSHTGVPLNEVADLLAKGALGL